MFQFYQKTDNFLRKKEPTHQKTVLLSRELFSVVKKVEFVTEYPKVYEEIRPGAGFKPTTCGLTNRGAAHVSNMQAANGSALPQEVCSL